MALPGAVIVLVMLVLTVAVATLAGLALPINAVLLAIAVLTAAATFAALALWTASWTPTAELAQMTSLPITTLTLAGLLGPVFPQGLQDWLIVLPGAAFNEVLHIAWFGRPVGSASSAPFDFWATWAHGATALAILAAWTVLALLLTRRFIRWEPRA